MSNASIDIILKLIEDAKPSEGFKTPSAEDDLWALNYVDSFAIVKLISLMEDRLGIVFDFADLNVGHFRTANAIQNLLVTKYGLKS